METIEDGGLHCVGGIRLGSARCGIKTHSDQPDVALVVSEAPASAAGVFTRNSFAAAPVLWCRRLLPTDNARAVLINAGNANACIGEQGERDVRDWAGLADELRAAWERHARFPDPDAEVRGRFVATNPGTDGVWVGRTRVGGTFALSGVQPNFWRHSDCTIEN